MATYYILYIFLNTKYRMVAPISNMISQLLYANQLEHDLGIAISRRPLYRYIRITESFQQQFEVNSTLMLYAIKGKPDEDNSRSCYNIINANMILNLVVYMIEKGFVQAQELVIMTFYRAQWKIYI